MPHKRNPIKSRADHRPRSRPAWKCPGAVVEDVALWHERDISHSSVERVILPDWTTLLDHMQRRALALVRGMVVDSERMRSNLDLAYGALFSQRVLLGAGRERADARRCLPGGPAARAAGDRRAHAAARTARRRSRRAPAWTSTRSSITRRSCATPTRSSSAWTRSFRPPSRRWRASPDAGESVVPSA